MDVKERFRDILKAKVPFYHEECGGLAFYYSHVPNKNEPINSNHVTMVDGMKDYPTDLMHCGTCGKPFFRMDVTLEKP